jgi:hypothetical protein
VCALSARAVRMARLCEHCGQEFVARVDTARFCSRPCLYTNMRTTVTVACPQCGSSFERQPKETKKYCGVVCARAATVGHRPYNLSIPEERECAACGKVFLIGGRGRPRKRQRFCSNDCKCAGRYRRGASLEVLTETQAAYVAGLLDGEGSIMLLSRGENIQVKITVTNTHRGVLDWLSEVTGVGSVVVHRAGTSHHRPTWFWQTHSDPAASLLQQVRSYMIVKLAQADLAIEAQQRLRDPSLKAEHSWQHDYREKMQVLNKRGPQTTYTATFTSGG